MKASPGSKFALSAVDRSVQLLGASSDLRQDQVRSLKTKYFRKSKSNYDTLSITTLVSYICVYVCVYLNGYTMMLQCNRNTIL